MSGKKPFSLITNAYEPAGGASKLLFAASFFVSAFFLVMLAMTGSIFRESFGSIPNWLSRPVYWTLKASEWLENHYLVALLVYFGAAVGAAVVLFGAIRRDAIRQLVLWLFMLLILAAWILSFFIYSQPILISFKVTPDCITAMQFYG